MRHALAVLIIALAAPQARPDTVTGQVVDGSGVGIAGVILEFSNGVTPLNPVTDPSGFFSVDVPADTYDIAFLPGLTSGFAPLELANAVVAGPTALGAITLQDAVVVTGTVHDAGGLPLVGVDTDLIDAITRQRAFTPSDNTDATGVFAVAVPAGVYDLRIKAPSGAMLVSVEIENLPVVGPLPTNVGIVVLQPGFALTGQVLETGSSQPLEDVDLDADDAATGMRIYTPGDNTDSQGFFSLTVPAGTFDISFDPPSGAANVARVITNVSVTGPTNLGSVLLDPGFMLDGTLVGSGGLPAVGVDLDVETVLGGVEIPLSGDDSDANGAFEVVVPAGTFFVLVKPQQATLLAGQRVGPVTVSADTTLPPITLQAGHVVSGTVTAFNGGPEHDADIDVLDPVTGEELVTVSDDTDATGAYTVVVPAGTWDVVVNTRKASFSRDQTANGVTIAGPTTLNFGLSQVPFFVFVDSGILPADYAAGTPLLLNVALYNPTGVTQTANITVEIEDPAGSSTPLFPTVPLTFATQQFAVFLFVPLSIPPTPAVHLGLPQRFRIRLTDPVSGAEYDRDSFRFRVQ